MSALQMDAKYTSPSGKVAKFKYETTERDTDLKYGVFVFPNRDGSHVQNQGQGAKSFPLACIFCKTDSDTYFEDATDFEDMLSEQGEYGELTLPYGTFKVLPTSTIKRTDNWVAGAGEAVVEITFTETLSKEESEKLDAVITGDIEKNYETTSDAISEDFAEAVCGITNTAEQLYVQSTLAAQTQIIDSGLEDIAKADSGKWTEFMAAGNELKEDIKTLYKKNKAYSVNAESVYVKALNIARLTARMLKVPADSAVSLSQKIAGYSEITSNLINQFKNDPFGKEKIKSSYKVSIMALYSSLSAIAFGASSSTVKGAAASKDAKGASAKKAAMSTSGGGAASRDEAVEAANNIALILQSVIDYRDKKVSTNSFIDSTSEAYFSLIALVQSCIHAILNAAFSLSMKRAVTLDRNRQVIELCAELYGSIENAVIDQFIKENNLNIEEIALIPMGRQVCYYV